MAADVTFDATESRLHVLVQDKRELRVWRNEFTSSYIQEIARKTGSPKTYLEFLQMLVGASRGCLRGTFFDILTINELRVLTAKKGSTVERVHEDPSKPSKRYMIVTQLNE